MEKQVVNVLETIFQQLLNGLTLGGIYALIALGYTMVYGIIKLINFAHGEIFMVGAFAGIFAGVYFTGNFVVAAIFAMAFCAILGLFVEKAAYRPLRESTAANMLSTAVMVMIILLIAYLPRHGIKNLLTSPAFYTAIVLFAGLIALILTGKLKSNNRGGSSRINALISAIGMSIIISNVVAIINGPQRATYPRLIELPMFNIGNTNISGLQIFIIVSSFALMYVLYFIVNKTKSGTAMRAVSQNINAAKLMGINPNKIIGLTFALGSALAGAAGVLVGMYYSVADPFMGSMYGLKAFVAAVLGGIGSIPGAMVGGIILGVAEVFGIAFIAPSFKDAIAFGILIIILIVKPTGIFGSRDKEKV